MAQLFRNNAFGALGASLTNVATTLTVATGQGDRFPAVTAPDFFMLTLQDASNNIEIVRVTARAAGADSMTITRAQEGTTARAWNIGDVAELRLTAFGLNPLAVLEGSATAAAIRAILDVPTRAGGDASGTWAINISGNAATATLAASATALQTARTINGASFNGTANIITLSWGTARNLTIGASTKSVDGSANVGFTLAEIGAADATATVNLTGNQTAAGNKSFSGSVAIGSSAAPATPLDVKSAGANVLTSAFTTGIDDLNFRLGAMNGVAGSTGSSQGKLGLFYLGVGETATIDFRRGGSTSDGSIAFRTAGNDRATLDNSGNFVATGNVTAFSDERLKADWADLPGLVERLALVKNGTYTRTDTGERQVGVSAQSLRQVLPEAVMQAPDVEDGFMSVAYGNAALAACVELAREVVQLRGRLAALEAK